MSRLIDADALYKLIDGGFDLDFDEVPETKAELLRMIDKQQTIEERKTGKWIKEPYMNDTWVIRCSECMKVGSVGSGKGFSFCPHCGADMRGDEDDSQGAE